MRKMIGNVKTQHLEMVSFACLCLNLLAFKYFGVPNKLTVLLDVVTLVIIGILAFRTKKKGTSYIPSNLDFLTIEKSFLIGNKLHTFHLEVQHLYNTLEKWRFFFSMCAYGFIALFSLLRIFLFILRSLR